MTPHPTKQEPKEQERTLAAKLRDAKMGVWELQAAGKGYYYVDDKALDEVIAALEATSTSKDETVAELADIIKSLNDGVENAMNEFDAENGFYSLRASNARLIKTLELEIDRLTTTKKAAPT